MKGENKANMQDNSFEKTIWILQHSLLESNLDKNLMASPYIINNLVLALYALYAKYNVPIIS